MKSADIPNPVKAMSAQKLRQLQLVGTCANGFPHTQCNVEQKYKGERTESKELPQQTLTTSADEFSIPLKTSAVLYLFFHDSKYLALLQAPFEP